MHQEQRAQQRDGDRGRHHQGRTSGSQEQDQHEHRQTDSDQCRLLDVADRRLDQRRVVGDHSHLDLRQVALHALQRIAYGTRDPYRVGAGLLVDRQTHALLPVHADQVADLTVGDDYLRHVPHTNHRAVASRTLPTGAEAQHDPLDVRRLPEARQAAHQEDAAALLQCAGLDVHIGRAQACLQIRQRQRVRLETVAIHQHVDLTFPSAGNPRLGHTLQPFQRRGHLAPSQQTQFGQVRTILLTDESEGHHRRLSRVEVPYQHLVHVRVGTDRPDDLLHLHEGEVHLRLPVEDDGGDQPAGACDLIDLADPAHGEQALLDLLAIDPFHLGRRAVAGTDGDDDGRRLQVGQQVEGQIAPGGPAENDQGRGDDRHRDRAARGQSGQRLHSGPRDADPGPVD